jgi:hypothetical protein
MAYANICKCGHLLIYASIFILFSFALFLFDPKGMVLGLEHFQTLQTTINGNIKAFMHEHYAHNLKLIQVFVGS